MTFSLFFLLLILSLSLSTPTSTSHKFKLQLHHYPIISTRSDNLTRIFIHQYLKGLRFFHLKAGFSLSKPHHHSHLSNPILNMFSRLYLFLMPRKPLGNFFFLSTDLFLPHLRLSHTAPFSHDIV